MDKLKELYYRPSLSSSFGGVGRLATKAKSELRLKNDKVRNWLTGQDAYTLHKPARIRFPRRPTIVSGPGDQLQADLMDVRSHSDENDGVSYILTAVDVFSKKAWGIPIKSKSGVNVRNALTKLFDDTHFRKMQTDKGK